MSTFLDNILFLNPWILTGLLALPLLWYLLRITPPPARLVHLPSMRFLEGLIPEHQTPSTTPWWILLLRLLIAALILIALAHPVHNPANTLGASGPVRLVLDNGWAAAQNWDKQVNAAHEILFQAGREEREVYILTTAPSAGQENIKHLGPLSPDQASTILKGLKPLPWPELYKEAANEVRKNKPETNIHSYWFSHGLDEGNFSNLARALKAQGGLTYITPKPESLPLMLRPPKKKAQGTDLEIAVDAPPALKLEREITVQALNEEGVLLDQATSLLEPEALPQTFTFDLPDILRSEIARFKIQDVEGAGGVFILDERYRKRIIGIIGPSEEAAEKPFIEARYYLKRALEPFATLHMGHVEALLKEDPSMMIAPDIAALPSQALEALEGWVKEGGLLLRFSGPNMIAHQGEIFLTPVPLRKSGRALGGALTWDTPKKLSPFPQASPFYGIAISPETTVSRQILAEPSLALEEKIWASLEDGTPLITASPLGRGLLVMIHTTASPNWSDLALSGTYVELLRRLSAIAMAGQNMVSAPAQKKGTFQPLRILDGRGTLHAPDSHVRPIPAIEFPETPISSLHPPGLYGRTGYIQALNIGERISHLKIPENIPTGVKHRHYGTSYEKDLQPLLLLSALILLLLDWLLMILISSLTHYPPFRQWLHLRKTPALSLTLSLIMSTLLIFTASPAYAQTTQETYADGLYLAYIKSGDSAIDATTRMGLENLAKVMNNRTSAEPQGVVALTPQSPLLIFFPLIYWPISNQPRILSNEALNNVQNYLEHGGTILFDTRDKNQTRHNALIGTRNTRNLSRMIKGLNIPALEPVPKDHVLSKSFYLLEEFPGRYKGGALWIESRSLKNQNLKSGPLNERDGVSSILIGSHDWASAWAAKRTQRASLPGGAQQQEMAYRFGVNLMMYALTGNYKADQVHLTHILERLGE